MYIQIVIFIQKIYLHISIVEITNVDYLKSTNLYSINKSNLYKLKQMIDCRIALAGVGVWTLIEKHPSLVLLTSGLYDLTAYILILAGKHILI